MSKPLHSRSERGLAERLASFAAVLAIAAAALLLGASFFESKPRIPFSNESRLTLDQATNTARYIGNVLGIRAR